MMLHRAIATLLVFAFLDSERVLPAQDNINSGPNSFFQIRVIDKETKRGVPLVELRTVNGIRFYSDSAGNIAFNEPSLLNKEIFFHVSSHGYQFPKDGFGFRGTRLKTAPGKKATIEIQRINLARRLYRITGAGIYKDTIQSGAKVPIEIPELNSQVVGCDSVVNAIYGNRLYWFWGDTNRPSYPLGNFQVTGAASILSKKTDPSKGIKLDYFQNKNGFVKSMALIPGKGPTWIFGAFVTQDKNGFERLIAKYEKIKPPMEPYKRGLVVFDDEKQQFKELVEFDMNAPVYPDGQAFIRKQGNIEYVYFATPFPFTRVENDWQKIQNSKEYESYTYFKSGTVLKKDNLLYKYVIQKGMIDRDKRGKLVYRWRKNAPPISPRTEQQLVQQGVIKEEETLSLISPTRTLVGELNNEGRFAQPDSSKKITLASGSVAWNSFRKKWVMIAVEVWGKSMLGEIWFTEAERLEGPWTNATKIVTHNNYSFYNPRHHPYFDQQNGKIIYFEGTYTKMFSGEKVATPRYNYNQIMYQLDLSEIPILEKAK